MRRIVRVVALVAGLGHVAPELPAQGAPAPKLAASLQRVFGPDVARDSLLLDGKTVYRLRRAGALVGFARVRDVRGKDQPITCLVALDSTLQLLDIDILVYRESYGGEVAYESWRKQFRGRGPADTLAVGRSIRGISGATISVNAVTAGVRATLAEFAAWRKEGDL
jgi:hypothetical protein